MLPEYKLHTIYGNKNHELSIKTNTQFFNNAYVGNVIGNVIPRRNLKQNTVMLDSWLSVGAAGENLYGVLKQDDDSIDNVLNDFPFLQNNNVLTGIPVNKRDGLKSALNVPRPTFFKIDSLASIFNAVTLGSSLTTNNGAWGCLGGAMGPDSLGSNRLLIAQLTTDGILSFELNIQIGKPNHEPEKYVAKNPINNEIQLQTLSYNSKETKVFIAKDNKLTKLNNKSKTTKIN